MGLRGFHHAGSGQKKKKKAVRSFQEKWESDFDWLKYEKDDCGNSTAYCSVCRAAANKSKYAKGLSFNSSQGSDYRKSSFRSHATSDMHTKALWLPAIASNDAPAR